MSEYVLPELPPKYRWESMTGKSFCLQKQYDKSVNDETRYENLGFVGTDFVVRLWKRPRPGEGHWAPKGKCETLQQALNMAAALVALGEADE